VSHSYQTYFSFPKSDLNLDCGLRDHVIMRFASKAPCNASILLALLLLHVCGVAIIILLDHDFHVLGEKNKKFLSFISKKRIESPPDILVTRNPN